MLKDESDPSVAWNMAQLRASLKLIRYFMGADWYAREILEHHVSNAKGEHAIKSLLWSGRPEQHVKIMMLGLALKTLGLDVPDTGLVQKMDELKYASFASVYFELKVAHIYARNGFKVSFIKPQYGKKTPDMAISKNFLDAMVECKKRVGYGIAGTLDQLRRAKSQIAAVGKPGIIWIEVPDNSFQQEIECMPYLNAIQDELRNMPWISCVMLSWEQIAITDRKTYYGTKINGVGNRFSLSPIPQHVWCNPVHLDLANLYGEIIPFRGGPNKLLTFHE